MTKNYTIVVAGGGAAGFFAAITCASSISDCEVIIVEKSPEPLAKVAISGGGRCNVTHACFEPDALVKNYPRGHRELLGPFHRWQPSDTVRWFEERGVPLKTEPDGRMFPVTNQSSTIVECLKHEAQLAGVKILTRRGLESATCDDHRFELRLTDGSAMPCNRLLLATGGNQNSPVFKIAESMGHTINRLCPSLFSFDCRDDRIVDLAGISVPDVEVSVPGTQLHQRGPLLITHWGFSGPAILKLSSWGAPQLADLNYGFDLRVNWSPGDSDQTVKEQIAACRTGHGRKEIKNYCPWGLPTRLWQALLQPLGLADGLMWNKLPREAVHPMIDLVLRSPFAIKGKSMNKDEFVTCGGVRLDEVNFKTMESRKCRGLYFAGEILDIDGVTGGFNFQAAWTTGWIAGKSMGQDI